jgi:mannitol/fructose-specific phosphotransferase system IIA component (Ntr-type)
VYEKRFEISPELQLHVLVGDGLGKVAEAIPHVAARLAEGDVDDGAVLGKALAEREQVGSTEVLPGVGMPHATLPGPGKTHVAFVLPTGGAEGDFKLLVFLLVRDNASEPTKLWGRRVVRGLADESAVEALYSTTSPTDFAASVWRQVGGADAPK